jgi:hypothetical protein
MDISKFRPINLINVGGKVLEKILADRIMHYVYSNNLLNNNQLCFTPKKKKKAGHRRRISGEGILRRGNERRAHCNNR